MGGGGERGVRGPGEKGWGVGGFGCSAATEARPETALGPRSSLKAPLLPSSLLEARPETACRYGRIRESLHVLEKIRNKRESFRVLRQQVSVRLPSLAF